MMPKLFFSILSVLLAGGSIAWAEALLEPGKFEHAAENYRAGDWHAALERFQSLFGRAGGGEAASKAAFYAGECLLQLGRHADAKSEYARVLAMPAAAAYHARCTFRLGEIAWLNDDSEEAEEFLGQFVRLHPLDCLAPIAWSMLGDLAAGKEESAKAISHYETAIKQESKPGSIPQARLGLARVLLAKGEGSAVPAALDVLTESSEPSTRYQALLLLGRAKYDAGQYNESLQLFRLASRLAPPKQEKLADLAAGWSLWKLARYDEIANELGEVSDESSLTAEQHYLLGMTAYRQKDWSTAIALLSQSVTAATASIKCSALFYLGECFLHNEQYDQAKKCLETLVKEHGESEWADDALWSLTKIVRQAGDTAEYERLSAMLRSHYPSSGYSSLLNFESGDKNSTKTSVQQEPRDTGLFEEAVGLERDGYYDAALAVYRQCLEDEAEKSVHAETLWRIARLHQRLKQQAEALTYYSRLVNQFPLFDRSAESILNLAQLSAEVGNHESAMNRFEEVVEKFPQTAQADKATYWLALAAADVKNSKRAEVLVDRLLSSWDPAVESDDPRQELLETETLCLKCQLAAADERWNEIAKLLSDFSGKTHQLPIAPRLAYWEAEADFRLKRFPTARQKFEALEVAIFGTTESWHPMVSLRSAQLAAREQQWKEVLAIVEQIENTYPKFELAYEADYLRGRALAGLGEFSAARDAYQEVLRNDLTAGNETAAMAQWMIGETYFHQQDYELAREAYRHVMQDHDFPEWQARAALQAGKCAELSGDLSQAAEIYEQARAKWPKSQVAKQLVGRHEWAARQAIHHTANVK